MENVKTSKRGLTSFHLKLIGIASMVCDHIGVVFFPELTVLRVIGRIAFPVFAFLLVEGYFHTKSIPRYMKRLFLLALISEVPYDLIMSGRFVDFGRQNVLFTLFLGVLMLYLFEILNGNAAKIISMIFILLVSEAIMCDYNATGLLMIFGFYVYYNRPWMRGVANAYINIQVIGHIQSYGILALVPIGLYNGREGRKCRILFYASYPVLLIVLILVKLLL